MGVLDCFGQNQEGLGVRVEGEILQLDQGC